MVSLLLEAVSVNLNQYVLKTICEKPGQRTRDIASNLGVDYQIIDSILSGPLSKLVFQDASYRWYHISNSRAHKYIPKDKSLDRLCDYYLDCLNYDNLGGAKIFLRAKGKQRDFVELPSLEILLESQTGLIESDYIRSFMNGIKRDRNLQSLFLGYPIRLSRNRDRKFLEPIFLFSYKRSEIYSGRISRGDETPRINSEFLRSMLAYENGDIITGEMLALAEELGLDDTDKGCPDIDDLLCRLKRIRPEWDWQEDINPRNLNTQPAISQITEQGIYNRAIFLATEHSPYTQGLEHELSSLRSLSEAKYRETSLGRWLSNSISHSPIEMQYPLLEILPLNNEQRESVYQALSNPLTVITGPPGTGKSQVVMSILINAAWQGQKVLFASKNNKAVDVVESRVNSLGSRPVLLRLGSEQHMSNLGEYLTSLLASKVDDVEHQKYRECERTQIYLQKEIDTIDGEMFGLMDLRNKVDGYDKRIDVIRKILGPKRFENLKSFDIEEFRKRTLRLIVSIKDADKSKNSFWKNLLWPFIKRTLYGRLIQAVIDYNNIAQEVGIKIKHGPITDGIVKDLLQKYIPRLLARTKNLMEASKYFEYLDILTKATSFEDIARKRLVLTERIIRNSEILWKTWLVLNPSRITAEQRKALSKYVASFQMDIASDTQWLRNAKRKLHEIFPDVASVLTCWAVTSLSVRGRIPFEPNFFDLLIIDEASQCDIASALPLLFRARRVVVLGDPKQLRHISNLSGRQDKALLAKYKIYNEFVHWNYSRQSLFDLASSLCKHEDIVNLCDHHRSHADIINFSNTFFYDGRLRIATDYDNLRIPNNDSVIKWIDIRGQVERPINGSAMNKKEAYAVVNALEQLIKDGYQGSVGVVSPFRPQANFIRTLIHNSPVVSSHLVESDILVDTVHRFQGDERDLIIFSPVLSHGMPESAIRFLKKSPNLFNVAITRARSALYVVGDKIESLNSEVNYLAKFAAYIEGVGRRVPSVSTIQSNEYGDEYPKVSNPEQVSEWEKYFYSAMYQIGLRPIPQYTVDKYDLDFAIVLETAKLNIEVDGERYHKNWDGELCRRDQIRNQRLIDLGWDVLRFWVYQLRDDLPMCLMRVKKWVEQNH